MARSPRSRRPRRATMARSLIRGQSNKGYIYSSNRALDRCLAWYILSRMKTVLLKLDESVHTIWVGAAKREKLSLSEWIRTQCNEALSKWTRKDEPSAAHDAGRVGGVAPRERRARVATGGIDIEQRSPDVTIVRATGSSVLAHAANCSCGLCASKRKSVKKSPE